MLSSNEHSNNNKSSASNHCKKLRNKSLNGFPSNFKLTKTKKEDFKSASNNVISFIFPRIISTTSYSVEKQ